MEDHQTQSKPADAEQPSPEGLSSSALLARVRVLEDERARLRAAIMQAVTVLDTDRDLSDAQTMRCRDDVKNRRLALRHCQSSLR